MGGVPKAGGGHSSLMPLNPRAPETLRNYFAVVRGEAGKGPQPHVYRELTINIAPCRPVTEMR
jgi:hypothetical protein